jgi:hypothetical protein
VASTPVPKSIIPTVTTNLALYDMDPIEIARQITLIEFELYKAISPTQCLNQAWNKNGKEETAPDVLKMIRWSNDISAWVNTEILKREAPKDRADNIKFFIRIAQALFDIRNFNAVFEILAGFSSSALDRLKKSWEVMTYICFSMLISRNLIAVLRSH